MPFPLSVVEFKDLYPAFATTDDALVQARLDMAARRTPESIWEEQAADGQGLLAAHLLSIEPFGQPDARIELDDGESVYLRARRRIKEEIAPAVAPRTT